MTTVNFKSTDDGKLIITHTRSDKNNKLIGDELMDALEDVKRAIAEYKWEYAKEKSEEASINVKKITRG